MRRRALPIVAGALLVALSQVAACSPGSESATGAGGVAGSSGSAGTGGTGGASGVGGTTADAGPDAVDDAQADGPLPCALGFLGDPAKAPELELTVRTLNDVSVPLVEGGDAPLITPPQGGRVIFLGVRATNLSPCSVQLVGIVRDTATAQIRIDGRGMNLKPTGDGWGASVDSNIATFANVPVCPNQWASTDIFDQSFEVSVTVTDPGGRMAQKTLHAVPRCVEAGALLKDCQCSCKKGYVLGQPCP